MIKLIGWSILLCSELGTLTTLGAIYNNEKTTLVLCLIILNILLLCVCAILTPHFMKEKEKNNDLHRNE